MATANVHAMQRSDGPHLSTPLCRTTLHGRMTAGLQYPPRYAPASQPSTGAVLVYGPIFMIH